jgi:hypothetical protein
MVAVECYALTDMKFKLRISCSLKREDNYSVVTLEVHGGVAEDFSLLEYDAMSVGEWFLTFQKNMMLSSSGSSSYEE